MRISLLGKKMAAALQASALVLSLAGVGVAVNTVVAPAVAHAAQGDCTDNPVGNADPLKAGAACSQSNSSTENLFGANGIFRTIANTLIYLVGAIAVLFLIIGGLRYVISNGDSKAVESAKNTILYAIIGIVVAVISFAAVNFVINSLK